MGYVGVRGLCIALNIVTNSEIRTHVCCHSFIRLQRYPKTKSLVGLQLCVEDYRARDSVISFGNKRVCVCVCVVQVPPDHCPNSGCILRDPDLFGHRQSL